MPLPPTLDDQPPGRSLKAQEFRRSWRVVIAAMLGLGLSGGSSIYWFGVMVGPLSRQFGWSNAAISGWALMLQIAVHVFAPLSGLLADRFGARMVALWSIPLVALGFAGAGLFMHTLGALYLAAFIVGVSGSSAAAYARAINTWFEAGRGLALGLAVSGAGITATFGPRITQAVVDSMGWRIGFIFLGVMTLLPLPVAFFWLHERREATNRTAPPPETGYRPMQSLRLPAFWLIGFGGLLYFLGYNGVGFSLIPFLTAQGISRANAADYAAVMGASVFFGKIITGFLFDRLRAPFVLFCLLLADSAAIAILLSFSRNGAVLALSIVGLTHGGIIAGLPYCIVRYFGLKSFASISGLTSIVFGFSAFGPMFFSLLRDRAGSYALSLMAASSVVFVAAVLLGLLGLRPYLPRATGDASRSAT